MFYVSLMVTTGQKPIVDTQRRKRKEAKHTTTESHQILKEESKKGTKELQINQEAIAKMVVISSLLSLITLNVDGLNSPIIR